MYKLSNSYNNPSVLWLQGLRSQRDQMFIDQDEPNELPRSVGAKDLAAEKHVSLLWSEVVLSIAYL